MVLIKKSKKGVIFTILALFLSAMFILILTTGVTNRADRDVDLIKSKTSMIYSHYESFISYSHYAFEISAKSCLNSITDYMITNGVFFTNQDAFIADMNSCMLISNISILSAGQEHLVSSENNTIPILIDILTNLTEEDYGIQTNYSVNSIDLNQTIPNSIIVTGNLSFNITSTSATLTPEYIITSATVDFIGIKDPFYSINLGENRTFKSIKLVGEDDFDLYNQDFNDFLHNVSYIQSSKGNSLLNKFINDTSQSSTTGLISFINDSALPLVRINNSYVDIFYINDTKFDCYELYCKQNECGNNDFAIDIDTFLGLKIKYNLSTDGWELKC